MQEEFCKQLQVDFRTAGEETGAMAIQYTERVEEGQGWIDEGEAIAAMLPALSLSGLERERIGH